MTWCGPHSGKTLLFPASSHITSTCLRSMKIYRALCSFSNIWNNVIVVLLYMSARQGTFLMKESFPGPYSMYNGIVYLRKIIAMFPPFHSKLNYHPRISTIHRRCFWVFLDIYWIEDRVSVFQVFLNLIRLQQNHNINKQFKTNSFPLVRSAVFCKFPGHNNTFSSFHFMFIHFISLSGYQAI